MNPDERVNMIYTYLEAYNSFDIEGMIAVLHDDIAFKNVVGSEVTTSAFGIDEFREVAERSKSVFRRRCQTIRSIEAEDDQVFIGIDFEGTLAIDLPNGMKVGEVIRITGRTEFVFRDGLIQQITDIS